jgi:hypothetical protein
MPQSKPAAAMQETVKVKYRIGFFSFMFAPLMSELRGSLLGVTLHQSDACATAEMACVCGRLMGKGQNYTIRVAA